MEYKIDEHCMTCYKYIWIIGIDVVVTHEISCIQVSLLPKKAAQALVLTFMKMG